ncbi:MAG: cell surface protein [Odoribacter sp.]|nr:cell surface protein [Odoribacter sp.]
MVSNVSEIFYPFNYLSVFQVIMKSLKTLISIISTLLFISCEKAGPESDIGSVEDCVKGDGVFIINEGNFMAGNGSLSFYSYTSGELYNDIFYRANGRKLGDVPYSMIISGDRGFIVVNNSGKIEIVNKNSVKVLNTISGLISPRKILPVNNEKAYVSSLYSNSVSIINLTTGAVSGSVNIRRSSEAMVLLSDKAYISSWYKGKDIIVVNTTTDKVIDSIAVAPEPESMVLDKNNKLWILCSGSYAGDIFAELLSVNTLTNEIEKKFVFPSKLIYPSSLQINGTRDTLYFVENGLWRMSIQASALPGKPFKPANGRLIYKLGVDPRNGRIFYTDALDYQQKGYLLQLNQEGMPVDSCRGDIIPGSFCFK